MPKHLSEALADPAQPVQLAALRATVELLDGVAEGEASDPCNKEVNQLPQKSFVLCDL